MTPTEAYEVAEILFKAMPKKIAMDYVGEWNDLLIFLGDLKRSDKK